MEKIKEILKLKTWSLEEFAWICAGFSPFDHPMNLTRLVDGAEVICGSVDYIAAKSEYDKYLGIVSGYFRLGPPVNQDAPVGLYIRGGERYRVNNLLVDYYLRKWQDGIDLPWFAWAVENGLLPAEVFRGSKSKVTGETGANSIRKKFTVKTVTTEMPDIYLWVINQLQEYSNKGKERPTMMGVVKLMQQKKCPDLVKVHGSDIIFWNVHKGDKGEEDIWTKEALKQFIYSNTSLIPEAK